MRFRLVVDGESKDIEIDRSERGLTVRVDGAVYRSQARASGDRVTVQIGPKKYRIRFEQGAVLLDDGRHAIGISEMEEEPPARASGSASRDRGEVEVRATMPGRVVRVSVHRGAVVKRGQTLVVLEAMKMQNEIPAPRDGVVRDVRVAEGESVTADRVVAVLEAR